LKRTHLIFLTLFFLLFNIDTTFSQSGINAESSIKEVFNKLILAYGNAKASPDLIILNEGKLQKSPAVYYTSTSPVIKVDINLYDICTHFGNDKLNALSIILSHELAHYYNDDTFCSDFAFAIKNENNVLSNKLIQLSKNEKIKLETEADHKGLFYAAMAGYKPFNIYPELLDRIYKSYNIIDNIEGYPTLNERKAISKQAEERIRKLYDIFQEGIKNYNNGNYSNASKQFEEINKYFPSRENYNNSGVAKVKQVLKEKPSTREESKFPKRFTYPLMLDSESHLKQPKNYTNQTRGYVDTDKFEFLLRSAQKDFEKAINLDPNYTKAYINLACVFDLLDNPMAAIGKIKELPQKKQQTKNAQQILAIAYYNAELEEKANEIWKALEVDERY